ncbi:unnamed protein product, partial [Bubo scandiacus]
MGVMMALVSLHPERRATPSAPSAPRTGRWCSSSGGRCCWCRCPARVSRRLSCGGNWPSSTSRSSASSPRGGIARVFARRRGYDLRRLLAGAEAVWTPVCLPRFNPRRLLLRLRGGAGRGGGRWRRRGDAHPAVDGARGLLCGGRVSPALGGDAAGAGGGWGSWGAAVKAGAGYGPARPGAPELRHFLYKPLEGPEEMQQLPQFTSPELEDPYTSEEEQHRLFDLYHYLHSRVHSPHRPLRLLYHVAEKETLLAWVTSKFELYGCFSPLVSKAGAIAVLTKLLRWLKKEEEWLFIRYPPPYCAAPRPPRGPRGRGL